MEQFCVFANSEESLNMLNDNAGGRFRVYFPKPCVLDGTWECTLLEVTFVPNYVTEYTECVSEGERDMRKKRKRVESVTFVCIIIFILSISSNFIIHF
jgi:hypothetical protein